MDSRFTTEGILRTSLIPDLLSDRKLTQAIKLLEVLFRWELAQIPVKDSLKKAREKDSMPGRGSSVGSGLTQG